MIIQNTAGAKMSLIPSPSNKVLASLIFTLFAFVLLAGSEAVAHRVNLFAWLEGDNVIVKCGFNRSLPVKGGKVSVVDSISGKQLATGLTNDEGVYVFRVPDVVRQGHGLRISVNAGEGHASEFEMNASEFYEAAALEAGFEKASLDAARLNQDTQQAGTTQNHAAAVPTARAADSGKSSTLPAQIQHDPDELRQVLDKTLQKHLAPIHAALGTGAGIGAGDIMAGLGWIIGIVGIACYVRSRRRK